MFVLYIVWWNFQKKKLIENLKEGHCTLFFCHSHSHSHNDIGNVSSKQQDKHCIRHYDCDYDKKIRYKYGP